MASRHPPRAVTIEFPAPTSYQQRDMLGPHRFGWIEAATKTGKTVIAFVWLFGLMCAGPACGIYWWLAPSDKQARMAYERACKWLAPLISTGRLKRTDSSPRRLTDTVTGAFIEFFTSANEDYIYGDEPDGVVVDEASRHKRAPLEEALDSVIEPKCAPVRYIGNTKNRLNYMWRMCRIIEAEQSMPDSDRVYLGHYYARWTVWDSVAAGLVTQEFAERKREQFRRRGAMAIWLRDYECRLDGVGLAFPDDVRDRMNSAPAVEYGATIFGIDPGGKRHPAGLCLIRVRMGEDNRPECEALHVEHWRGSAPDLWARVCELSDEYTPDHWVTDAHMPMLTGSLEERYGKGRVSHPQGTEARMWGWYEAVRDLAADGRLRAPDDAFPELHADMENVAIDDEHDDRVVLVEYDVEEWDERAGEMVTRVVHCDGFDALLRAVSAMDRFVAAQEPADVLIAWL